jgi:hypothetical protein
MSREAILRVLRDRIASLQSLYNGAKGRGALRASSTTCYEWASGRMLLEHELFEESLMTFDGHLTEVLKLAKVELDRSTELKRLSPVVGNDKNGKLALYLMLRID